MIKGQEKKLVLKMRYGGMKGKIVNEWLKEQV